MKYPEFCYSHDLENNCIIIQWGESGYHPTNYPKGEYTDAVIDAINEQRGISQAERKAMELCSMAAQNNPNLDWGKHYEMVMGKLNKGSN